MANPTYAKLQKQIAELEAQAVKVKSGEVAGVVARIREAIAIYGLTAQDLFGSKSVAVKSKSGTPRSRAAKYVDGKGGEWVGRGKRPQWLSDALAEGRKLEDFVADKFKAALDTLSPPAGVVADPVPEAPKKRRRQAQRAAAQKSPTPPRYADGAGHAWSGMGPTPKWLKEAIAAGQKREDFLAKT